MDTVSPRPTTLNQLNSTHDPIYRSSREDAPRFSIPPVSFSFVQHHSSSHQHHPDERSHSVNDPCACSSPEAALVLPDDPPTTTLDSSVLTTPNPNSPLSTYLEGGHHCESAPPSSHSASSTALAPPSATPSPSDEHSAVLTAPCPITTDVNNQEDEQCACIPARPVRRLEHLTSAALAATVSTIAVQPLDVLRTRLQVHHVPLYSNGARIVSQSPGIFASLLRISHTEGLRGLYRGVIPSLMSVVPSISIYFTLYSELKTLFGVPTGSYSYDTAMQSFAAGLSSCATSAVTNPLWVVKARMQITPAKSSTSSLVGGSGANIPSYPPFGRKGGSSLSPFVRFPFGASPFAGFRSGVLTSPLLTLRSMYLSRAHTTSSTGSSNCNTFDKTKSGTIQTICRIAREEGARGLYRGLSASILTSSQAMIQFPLYESLKRQIYASTADLVQDEVRRISMSYLSASALAASFACVATYPCEVVRSRLQVQGMNPSLPRKYKSLASAFRTICREEGFRGLYRGMGTSLLRLTPAHALSFTTYEFILRLMRDNSLTSQGI